MKRIGLNTRKRLPLFSKSLHANKIRLPQHYVRAHEVGVYPNMGDIYSHHISTKNDAFYPKLDRLS